MKVNRETIFNFIQPATAVAAVMFGLLTVFAGSRVWLDLSDPGYIVFLPLLIFNTVMGAVYVVSGVVIWKNHRKGRNTAKWIYRLNGAVLLLITVLYLTNGLVAPDSVMAMTLRTGVWFIFYMGLAKVGES